MHENDFCLPPWRGTQISGQLKVNGTLLSWSEFGWGEPLVLLHGELADQRAWQMHMRILGRHYRTIAYTQRHFGARAGLGAEAPCDIGLYAADLADFIDQLSAGPVHLVACSFSAHVALRAALDYPDRVRSLLLFEPSAPGRRADDTDARIYGRDANAIYGPVLTALRRADAGAAVRCLIDAYGLSHGYFDRQTSHARAIQMDNAHTVSLPSGLPSLPGLEQTARLTLPVGVVTGRTCRPAFELTARDLLQALSDGRRILVPNASHMWPGEDPAGFCATVAAFLEALRPVRRPLAPVHRQIAGIARQTVY
ncbi:alpha/beta fold hydrolase [Paludibacterium paludis]|uniref:AB hydrolase-1 domain-containing protein n=1 Tax=Paludibacterium paludis TaxID=1225769 RepID=A0A918P3A8_9NEIS|nr:alpha/beta hydrolase [Paludibacterium paludis]GGY17738.1 hypothetical protein GCM10011289_21570 [Paludibacterium paludis]